MTAHLDRHRTMVGQRRKEIEAAARAALRMSARCRTDAERLVLFGALMGVVADYFPEDAPQLGCAGAGAPNG